MNNMMPMGGMGMGMGMGMNPMMAGMGMQGKHLFSRTKGCTKPTDL
jgi:hypothetical protein